MADRIQDFEVNSPRWLSLEDFEGEIWKDMCDFDNPYAISNMGRIKCRAHFYTRIGRNNKEYTAFRNERIMYAHDNGRGYLWVCLDGKKNRRSYIHRLVAKYYISNPKEKPEIDHINTNRSDNRSINLRWVSRNENVRNPITLEKNRIAQGIPVVLLNCWGEYQGEFFGAQDLADHLGIERSVVNDAISQKRDCRFANGFIVVRKEEYDPNKTYVKIYKRGTSKFTHIPNEKMVLVFRDNKLYTVFPNTQIAANFYEVGIGLVSKRCRENGRGEIHENNDKRISDELYYYKDVTPKCQEIALQMFKDKYKK